MAKSLREITEIIDNFGNERGWKNDDPNQLISSILIELGELAEHYQWKNSFSKLDAAKKQELGYEFVDVVIYLFRLASKSGIDIEKYFDEKIVKLAKKFPIGLAKEDYAAVKDHYRKTGKNKTYD